MGPTKPSHAAIDQVKEAVEFSNSAAAGETRPSASYAGTLDQKNVKSGCLNSTQINNREYSGDNSNQELSFLRRAKNSVTSSVFVGYDLPPTKNDNEICSFKKIKNKNAQKVQKSSR